MNFIDNAAVDVRLGDYKMTNAVTPQRGITAMRCQIACSKYLITCKRCR